MSGPSLEHPTPEIRKTRTFDLQALVDATFTAMRGRAGQYLATQLQKGCQGEFYERLLKPLPFTAFNLMRDAELRTFLGTLGGTMTLHGKYKVVRLGVLSPYSKLARDDVLVLRRTLIEGVLVSYSRSQKVGT